MKEILEPDSTRYLDIVDSLQNSHLSAARDALAEYPESLKELEIEIKSECSRLRSFMAAAEVRCN